MKPGGGKAKGASFERMICKMLSEWWGEKDAFWRSPGSGAKATVSKSKPFYGDISSPSATGKKLLDKLVIELKKGYGCSWSPFDLLDGGPKTFTTFLEQVERDRKSSGRRYSWLIFQRPRKQICICTQANFISDYYDFDSTYLDASKVVFEYNHREWIILKFEDFLSICSPEELKN